MTVECLNCGKPLTGRKRKYCSNSCKLKLYRKTHPEFREQEVIKKRVRRYKTNKFVKKLGDKHDQHGENGPNWKGGTSRASKIKYNKRYRKQYPERIRAGRKVQKAVKSGELKQENCMVCGDEKTIPHHEDYSTELDVKWLCIKHHTQYHFGKVELPN